MKLSEVGRDAPSDDQPKRLKLSEVGKDASPAEGGLGGLFKSFLNSKVGAVIQGAAHGLGSAAIEAGKMGADLLTPAIAGRRQLVGNIADMQRQRAQEHAAQPYVRAHPGFARGGEIAGEIVPSLAIPGAGMMRAATLPGRLAGDAALGAAGASLTPTQGTDFWSQKLKNLGFGAGAGAAGGAALRAVGGLTREVRPEAQALMRRGVELTPGQQSGGRLQRVEANVSAFPVLGDYLRGVEGRSVEGFNRAALSQALEPIGVRVPRNLQAGHDLIEYGKAALSRAYDSLLPRVRLVEDEPLQKELGRLRGMVEEMGDDAVKRFDTTMRNRVDKAFGAQPKPPSGSMRPAPRTDELGHMLSLDPHKVPASYVAPIERSMDGMTFKTLEMDLDKAVRMNRQGDGTARQLASAFEEVRSLFRQAIARQNPEHAAMMQNIDHSYAMMSRLRDAAERRADSEGVFTPYDLLQATKQGSHKFGNNWNHALGSSLLQDFAEAGNRVLKKKLPTGAAAYRGPLHELGTLIRQAGSGVEYAARVSGIGGAAKSAAPYAAASSGGIGGQKASPSDRVKASQKVSEIQRDLHDAKRRGDLDETRDLTRKLADAWSDYRKLRPPVA